MSTNQTPASTILVIVLLVANLGLSTYIAFRPSATPTEATAKGAPTSAIGIRAANKLADALVPLYNAKKIPALYERFDPLAKVQFSEKQLGEQMEKLGTVIGQIESYAYSHATIAGTQDGRTYYLLHYKVRLTEGSFPVGELTLTVVQNGDDLGLFGFFINGTTSTKS